MKPSELQTELARIKEQINAGSIELARAGIATLSEGRVPRAQLLELAELARLAELPRTCLKLLRPVVRPGPRLERSPTEKEKAEYAIALSDIHAHQEALQLFKSIDTETLPYTLIYRSWILFRHCRWDEAIPLLERYLANPAVPPAEKIGARVNLAYALIQDREETVRSREILLEARELALRPEHTLYYRYIVIGLAQVALLVGDLEEASRRLDEFAELCVRHEDRLNMLRCRQWRCRLLLRTAEDTTGVIRDLARLRDEAAREGYSEIARNSELMAALHLHDEKRLIALYYRSSLPAFRRRIVEALGGPGRIPATWDWNIGTGPDPVLLNVSTGENSRGPGFLKSGQKLQLALEALLGDRFRESSLGVLHEKLFAGEHFNPLSSPDRVHQVLKRLRAWFEENRIPLAIEHQEGFYRLTPTAACVLRLRDPGCPDVSPADPAESSVDVRIRQQMIKMREAFGAREFSAREVSGLLAVSHRSVNDYLRTLAGYGLVRSKGAGPGTRYEVALKNSG